MRNVVILFLFLSFSLRMKAQVSFTGFESYADETAYLQSSWVADGFTVPWVNGFNQNRGYIDNAYSKNGTKSLRMFYPAGQFGTANTGGQAPLMVTPANQYYASYWVRFSDNFSWGTTSEGGKLPGLAGGGRCSGCAVCTGSNGFTARLMWRNSGRLVLYLYHLDKTNPPCGDNLTLQLSGSDYYAPKGQWIQIIERVKVNTGTNHDGEVELWINEQPALLVTGIQFVSNGDLVDNLYFSTFHGGSTSGWAPQVDSYIWFDDIKISTNPADIFTSLGIGTGNNQENKTDIAANAHYFSNPMIINEPMRIETGVETAALERLEWWDAVGNLVENQPFIKGYTPTTPQVKPGLYTVKLVFKDKVSVQRVIVLENK